MTAEATAPLVAPTTVVESKNIHTRSVAKSAKLRLPQTLEEYADWQPKDGFKYEWVDDKLLKLDKMKENELHIVTNLTRLFITTEAFAKGDILMPEVRSKTTKKQRRAPDIAYFTIDQQLEMYNSVSVTPLFLVEVISPSNDADEMIAKLMEYFDNGVEVVWYIYPKHKVVCVFDSPESYKMCRGKMLCSAEKVIAGFSISVEDIFRQPQV
jgi:Uma2 family endonuclease